MSEEDYEKLANAIFGDEAQETIMKAVKDLGMGTLKKCRESGNIVIDGNTKSYGEAIAVVGGNILVVLGVITTVFEYVLEAWSSHIGRGKLVNCVNRLLSITTPP